MRFLTVDWGLNYKHYAKDVGMIPYLLEKKYGYDSVILGTSMVENYTKPYDDYEVKTIIVEKKYKSDFLNVCRYIRKNGKNIDCLNLYHMKTKYNYFLSRIYKSVNPKGIIYLKLDMGYRGFRLAQNDNFYKFWIKKIMLKKMDLITDENSEVCGMLERLYNVPFYYIPNGWYGEQKKYSGKRDIDFLYVGRIGIREKGVDVLLEAFKLSNLKRELYLVGKIEPNFQNYLDNYFKENPQVIDKIHILGEIRDLHKLSEIYDRTKVLIVPSRWESFGIVLVEAQAHGCYIIASDKVSSAHDVILNNKMGCLFKSENCKDLADKLDNVDYDHIDIGLIYSNSLKFQWDIIIEKIYVLLNGIKSKEKSK